MQPTEASHQRVRKHFTWPQRRSLIVCPHIEVAEFNRGSGKTEKVLAPRVMHNAFTLPGSLGMLVAPTYKKLFQELAPAIVRGWEDLGYIEGKHFLLKKQPPKAWGKPIRKPTDWGNSISFCNSSVLQAISQDRPEMGVGLSCAYALAEEGRLLDGDGFMNRLRQTLRGYPQWEHLSECYSMLIVTDKGLSKKDRWYHVFKRDHDDELVQHILKLAYRRQKYTEAITKGNLSNRTLADYTGEVARITELMNEMRRVCTMFHTSNAVDVIEFIGFENLLNMERTMDPVKFAITMMGEDVDMVEGAWYNGFDDTRHTYMPQTTSWTTERGLDRDRIGLKDSRHDAEISTDQPLDIALDYGGRFNCMAVGQMFRDLLRIDRGFHATHPDKLQDVLQSFCDYYKYHRCKRVNYFWDHTAKMPVANSRHLYFETVITTLKENGWDVNDIYIGHTPAPKLRYEMVIKLLAADNPPVMWNPDGCSDMLMSMKFTRIKEGRAGIEKDKNVEKTGSLEDQLHAPHYGDAVDTLLWGRLETMGDHASVPIASLFSTR